MYVYVCREYTYAYLLFALRCIHFPSALASLKRMSHPASPASSFVLFRISSRHVHFDWIRNGDTIQNTLTKRSTSLMFVFLESVCVSV